MVEPQRRALPRFASLALGLVAMLGSTLFAPASALGAARRLCQRGDPRLEPDARRGRPSALAKSPETMCCEPSPRRFLLWSSEERGELGS